MNWTASPNITESSKLLGKGEIVLRGKIISLIALVRLITHWEMAKWGTIREKRGSKIRNKPSSTSTRWEFILERSGSMKLKNCPIVIKIWEIIRERTTSSRLKRCTSAINNWDTVLKKPGTRISRKKLDAIIKKLTSGWGSSVMVLKKCQSSTATSTRCSIITPTNPLTQCILRMSTPWMMKPLRPLDSKDSHLRSAIIDSSTSIHPSSKSRLLSKLQWMFDSSTYSKSR